MSDKLLLFDLILYYLMLSNIPIPLYINSIKIITFLGQLLILIEHIVELIMIIDHCRSPLATVKHSLFRLL